MSHKIYEVISNVQEELSKIGISKNKKNEQQGFKFRGIDDVLNALSPLLAKHRLCIFPRCVERQCVERTTSRGSVIFYVTVKVEYDFVADDGSRHTVVTYGEAMDSADKATNKAMSAAYKYAAFQTFCIPTEETSVDADSSTPEEISTFSKEKRDSVVHEIKKSDTIETIQALLKQSIKDGASPIDLDVLKDAARSRKSEISA